LCPALHENGVQGHLQPGVERKLQRLGEHAEGQQIMSACCGSHSEGGEGGW
jgi:hypothetical protein